MRDPDADRDSANLWKERGCHSRTQPLGERPGPRDIAVWQQDHEFLASPACQEIRNTQIAPHPSRELDQHLITRCMPMAVVDGLEVIDIEEQQGQGLLVSPGPRDFSRGGLLEVSPVPGAGQAIRRREQTQLGVRGL